MTEQPHAATNASLTDEIAKKLHEAIDRITVHANVAEERILSATRNMEDSIKGSTQVAKAKADEVSGGVREYVNEHPIASLGIAFGAGLIIAALLRRD
jgi:ElaB/YqjD/DUF883 family membrane-anchored ribosome-binding protein